MINMPISKINVNITLRFIVDQIVELCFLNLKIS